MSGDRVMNHESLESSTQCSFIKSIPIGNGFHFLIGEIGNRIQTANQRGSQGLNVERDSQDVWPACFTFPLGATFRASTASSWVHLWFAQREPADDNLTGPVRCDNRRERDAVLRFLQQPPRSSLSALTEPSQCPHPSTSIASQSMFEYYNV